jgi:hypothetical protein
MDARFHAMDDFISGMESPVFFELNSGSSSEQVESRWLIKIFLTVFRKQSQSPRFSFRF